jgi:hypothetical protein
MQVTNAPVFQALTRPHTRYEPSNGPPTAVFPAIRHPHGRTGYRRLDVSRWHRSRVKCSKPNVTRSTTRIVSSYDPQTVISEKLRVCFTPSKNRERRTRRSPIWFEPDRSQFLPVAVEHTYPREDVHREDVRVGSADALTRGQSSGGGEFHIRNERHWTFVCEQQGVFDVLTSRPCHKDGVCEKD